MRKYLVVVDMQNDFVDGALGTPEAVTIVPKVVEKINGFNGSIFVTMDTHDDGYMNTLEGHKLPVPHCVQGTEGYKLNGEVMEALGGRSYNIVRKNVFGSVVLAHRIVDDLFNHYENPDGAGFSIELVGLCTDICVVANAIILKTFFPEAEISVDASCCAGTTPDKHRDALNVMKSCQISVH